MKFNYASQSAFPITNYLVKSREDSDNEPGLTKLQLAALMIAPDILKRFVSLDQATVELAASQAIRVAATILKTADNYNSEK